MLSAPNRRGAAVSSPTLAVCSDEAEDAPPGVIACLPVPLVGPVEERVWSALVGHDLVRDPGRVQSAPEPLDVFLRDPPIGPAEQPQDRTCVRGCQEGRS